MVSEKVPAGLISPNLRIGTAGWSIPLRCAASFKGEGSHLERYSRVFSCAEINSSFHRPHQPKTYARWAAATPEHFRFSVKIPKTITHQSTLKPSRELIRKFLMGSEHLGHKLGPLLFQLPPSQQFVESQAETFLDSFRDLQPVGRAVMEPRHASWFSEEASVLLRRYQFGRVIADPARHPGASEPAGDLSFNYYRLHGSPRMYYSSYSAEWIDKLAAAIVQRLGGLKVRSKRTAHEDRPEVWCIFDNTASGAAAEDALALAEATRQARMPTIPEIPAR